MSSQSPDVGTYKQTLAREYSLITAQNSCKWSPTEPGDGQYDFAACDFLMTWTQQSHVNQTFRGHNLCWGIYNPEWLLSLPAEKLESALTGHVTTVLNRYGDKAYGWDVVNEALTDQSNPLVIFKNNTWYPAVQDYVNIAFTTARNATSGTAVKLFYNDYNVGSATGWSQKKSLRMYDMARDMHAAGILDGVGLQLHVDTSYDLADGVSQNIGRYEDLGIEVHLTEVDVGCISKDEKTCDHWSDNEEQQQAEVYAALLQACLDHSNCKSFETWGFTDAHTWRSGQHPLPFNETYGEKLAVGAMRDTLQKALTGERSEWVDRYHTRVEAVRAANKNWGSEKWNERQRARHIEYVKDARQ